MLTGVKMRKRVWLRSSVVLLFCTLWEVTNEFLSMRTCIQTEDICNIPKISHRLHKFHWCDNAKFPWNQWNLWRCLRVILHFDVRLPMNWLVSEAEIEGLKRRLSEKSEAFGGTDNIPDARISVFRENLRPGGKIPVIVSPENLNIIILGDVSGYDFGALYLLGAHSIKPVRQPLK